MSQQDCSQGKLRGCPPSSTTTHLRPVSTTTIVLYLAHFLTSLHLTPRHPPSPRAAPSLSLVPTLLLFSLQFIHCFQPPGQPSLLSGTLFHSLPTALLFFVLGGLDTTPTRRLFSTPTHACSRTAALPFSTLTAWSPDACTRHSTTLDTAFIPPNQPSSPPSSGPNYRRIAHSYETLDSRVL